MAKNIAVLVSGGGTNLQALIDAQGSVLNSGKITLVVANNAGAYALERAKKAGIDTAVVLKKECGSQEAFETRLMEVLDENGIDIIILAGFMTILTERFTAHYPKRILNVHPRLIPAAEVEKALEILSADGETAYVIGEIIEYDEMVIL